ncbi:MAG: hypothetical protein KDA96_16745 [Planctomycetaceae bacterium]|nr:hypothetical protein [Planctomycetaceae bacterium]
MSVRTSPEFSRRGFLQASVAAAGAWAIVEDSLRADQHSVSELRVAAFRFDVTPPMGHSMCGGWIKPAEAVDDELEAIGVVILGAGAPVVLCAVDWTGLLNDAHVQWRTALAEAAGTTPERVAVHCVHQHNAPFACLEAERIVQAEGDLPHIVDLEYFDRCLTAGRKAVKAAVSGARQVTHIGFGQAPVRQVAANRRVSRTPDGKIKAMRGSACKDEALRALPEGTIDPNLKTIAFYDGETAVAACHYYACHPMSYYGDGRVSSDFVGLARKRRQAETPECTHLYFTGCAGNVAAGKYNDGSIPMRQVLADRIYQGIVDSENSIRREPLRSVGWHTLDVIPLPRPDLSAEALQAQISNKDNPVVGRNRPSYMLSWLRRLEKKTPIVISSLHLNDGMTLHMPAESFIEYQLRAQNEIAKGHFVATAAYGDGGSWYVPVAPEYPNGGYEVSVAFSDPSIDDQLTAAMKAVLASDEK